MIKVLNKQLTKEAIEVLNNLLDKEINPVSAFKMAKIAKELHSIIEIKNKTEESIYKRGVEFDENGNPVPVKNNEGEIQPNLVSVKDAKKFSEEINDLMNYENDLNFPKIKIDELGLGFSIKPIDLIKIDFIFE
jgi:hypothetical protein